MVDDEGSVKNDFVSFFRSRWSTNASGDVSFALPDPISCVINQENSKLIKIISIKEIKRMLWSMAKAKVLGLNGFSLLFFKRYWLII